MIINRLQRHWSTGGGVALGLRAHPKRAVSGAFSSLRRASLLGLPPLSKLVSFVYERSSPRSWLSFPSTHQQQLFLAHRQCQ